jgi:hypothetical protein
LTIEPTENGVNIQSVKNWLNAINSNQNAIKFKT